MPKARILLKYKYNTDNYSVYLYQAKAQALLYQRIRDNGVGESPRMSSSVQSLLFQHHAAQWASAGLTST